MGVKKKRIEVYARKVCGCCNVTMYFDSIESAQEAFDVELGPSSVTITDDRGKEYPSVDPFYGFATTEEELGSRGFMYLLEDVVGPPDDGRWEIVQAYLTCVERAEDTTQEGARDFMYELLDLVLNGDIPTPAQVKPNDDQGFHVEWQWWEALNAYELEVSKAGSYRLVEWSIASGFGQVRDEVGTDVSELVGTIKEQRALDVSST